MNCCRQCRDSAVPRIERGDDHVDDGDKPGRQDGREHHRKENTMVAPRIRKEEVLARKDDPDTFVIDVRRGQKQSDRKIQGAAMHDPEAVGAWSENYDIEQVLFLYCS